MRIAALVHQFPPDFETGTEILCLETMKGLTACGHEVRVFAGDPLRLAGAPPRRDTVEGIDVLRVPSRRLRRFTLAARMKDEFSNPQAEGQFLPAVASFAPDVVHAFQALQIGIAALPRLAAAAPLVVTATDFHLACPSVTGSFDDGRPCDGVSCLAHVEAREAARLAAAPGLKGVALRARALAARLGGMDGTARREAALAARRETSRAALRAASAVLAGSARIRDMLIAAGAPLARTHLFAHAAPPLDVPQRPVGTPLRVAFFGTLAPHKGPHVFLDAIARLPAATPLAFLLCGGDGPDTDYAAAVRARAASLGRVEVRPPVPHPAFGALMAEADVVVLPSLWEENRPLVLLGALEAGRYVLASDMPGLAVFPAPEGGRVFPAGDDAALADLLARLAGDPEPVRQVRARPALAPAFPAYVRAVEAHLAAAAEARR